MIKRLFVGFSSQKSKGNTTLYDIALVNQDLLNHFHTRKGERRMLPLFGVTFWDKLFEPFTTSLRDEIIEEATTVVNSDSRVQLVAIEVIEMEFGIKIAMTLKYNPFGVVGNFAVNYDKRMANRSYE